MYVDLQPFWEASLAIQIHIVSALCALILGSIVLFRRKGGTRHRQMGKVWVGLMAIVALSSIFIHEIRIWGPFSPIHIFTIFTLASLVYAIWTVRRGNIVAHRYTMIGLFSGGLVFAGILALARGLTLHRIFIAPWGGENLPSIAELPGGPGIAFIGAGAIFVVFMIISLRDRRLAGHTGRSDKPISRKF